MGIPDLEVKKMVYLFLINYARARAEIANHAVNGFEDDVNDSNPLVRAMAIRTMGYIYVERVIESLIDPLRHCLRDRDPYVRKTAAMAVLKLCMFDRSLVEEERFLDMLKDLLADGNPSVVANAVAALTEISERSPNIKLKLNMKIANKLITALNECNEWGQVYILESLMYVTPQDSNDAETIIERIMPRLQHGNSSVVLVAVKVIAYMMNYVGKVEALEQILHKLSPPLVTLLTAGPEVQYITLRNIQLLLQRWPTILQNQMRAFFCKYDDPIYVKLAKLEVILALTTEENARVVLTELVEYATEIDVDFVRKAVRSIGRIAIKIELAADRCVRALLDLIQTKVNYVVQEAIVVIRDIFRKYPNRYEAIIGTLCENLDSLDEPEARAAMIWIIGQYADRIDNSDEVLDTFLDTFLEETGEVQLALLTAIVKLFIMRPSAGQELVPKVLKWATEEVDSPDIRDRGFIYWRLLSTDPELARTVVLSDKPEITAEAEKIDMPLLEELLLQVGTLSAIYRKPPVAFINFAKRRVLGTSPALTRLTINPPPTARLPRANPSAMSQPANERQSNRQSTEPPATTRSSTQLNSSVLDVSGNAGLSNPYINDVAPGMMQGGEAVLIDLMTMDDDEDEAHGNETQITSGGMVGFNANYDMTGMSMVQLGGVGQAPDSQVLNSAFDAAGLDALGSMATPVGGSMPGSSQSPGPMMRNFTSSFDVTTAGAGGVNGSSSGVGLDNLLMATNAGPSSPFYDMALSSQSSAAGLGPSPFPSAAISTPASNTLIQPLSSAAITNTFQQQQQPATVASALPTPINTTTGPANDLDQLAKQMFSTNLCTPTGNATPNAPYVPSRTVLLDAQQAQGLEILGTFARRGGQIQMEMVFANKSNVPVGDFAIQFNKNTYGLVPSTPLNVGTLMPMTSSEVTLPLAMGGPTMPMQPLTNLQIAIKCSQGVFYFQTQYSLHILLGEDGRSDQGVFLRMWKDIPETMQMAQGAQNIRFASMEDMRNKLNMNGVFTVAQRSVGDATHFYTSSKLCDGSMFYSEIKVASNFSAALISTKSPNVQLIPLYQKAVQDIMTAF
ncbi:Adaptor protein complex beta subunit [Linderina pennispora]|uniref:AP complex subunit beta n=1 Tax=Linderina pennispora TaxID=61395 RepID=A0A1Y1WDG4_9FUNG|nr:Adaptor protein complex beta subunit [Linderina pennispora]ORX71492.1 Adaptor protein complex beta subunit [Linderina pennispora]